MAEQQAEAPPAQPPEAGGDVPAAGTVDAAPAEVPTQAGGDAPPETQPEVPLPKADSKTTAQSVSISGDTTLSSSKPSTLQITHSHTSCNFMEKRSIYKVIVDDIDYTPDNLVDPDYFTMEDRFSHSAFETRTRFKSETALKPGKSATGDLGMKVFATTINLDDIHIDYTLNTEEGITAVDLDLDIAPSAFYLPKIYPPMKYPPQIFVTLKETETIPLFDLPCYACERGTAESAAVEQDNEFYMYITVGKGRNRKMVNEETQTTSAMFNSRHTLYERPQKKNAICFASLWDMHDTYAQLASLVEPEPEDEMVMYQSAAAYMLRKKKVKVTALHRGKTFQEIVSTPQFLDAILLTERVIAANEYGQQQKKFRGLMPPDPLAMDLVYIYSMKPLWKFEYGETLNKAIACIAFNPANENILAVGHGKFTYAEEANGVVAIWCTKNPMKPERLYKFQHPLTSCAFSNRNPNWLACGFSNGDVLILDITYYETKIVAQSERDTNPCFEPIWSVNWHLSENRETEFVMTTCQDGRINRFTSTKSHDFICTPMMRVTTVEGKMKGLEIAKTCTKVDVPITRYPAALCMKWHPSIYHVYMVGTDEGCIHKCSTHYLNQHMEVYRAHAGPVYALEISPFKQTMLVSCGADSALRLWIDGIQEEIITLVCPGAVYGVSFCPINSTVLLSISGNVLSVWDLRRKIHQPCAEYTFPRDVTLTYIKFSSSGDNVFVGDTSGRIHTFHLEDTPIPPYYQNQMLDDAIKKSLCTRPHLLKQLEKLEKFRAL